jgi:predicted DNA-binding transcriptional regulator AlpA
MEPFSTTSELLDTSQVAALFGSTPQFVEKLRSTGRGPEFLRIGRLVRYKRTAIEAWLEKQTASRTSVGRPRSAKSA